VIGVGYQGRTLDESVAQLVAMDVSRLVDVRLNAISESPASANRPRSRVDRSGDRLRTPPRAWQPQDEPIRFRRRQHEWEQARSRYSDFLRRPEAIEALEAVAKAASEGRVAVLCFEADEHRCHRDLVLADARQRLVDAAATKSPPH
jgi:uncharacterized protein (DUF488 family)